MGIDESQLLSSSDQIAIAWSEGMRSLIQTGEFTREEAFELVTIQWEAYWAMVYSNHPPHVREEEG